MSSAADAAVSAIIAKWCAGFATLDAVALSSLYSKNASINMGATITFDLAGERPDLVVKMSWVIIREDGDWKIVNHHASAKAPLI